MRRAAILLALAAVLLGGCGIGLTVRGGSAGGVDDWRVGIAI